MNFISVLNFNIRKIKELFFQKNIFFLLPIIIIFSSLKFYGYVFFFFLCIPYIYKKRDDIIFSLKHSEGNQKSVLLYFIFLILQVILGSVYLKDIRVIIFWIPLLATIFGIYYKNIYDLKFNIFYKLNYTKIIFISSLIYFIFYFVLSFLAYFLSEGFYSIQDNFWIGSSSAFGMTSLLFFSMYELWEKSKFKIYSIYSATLLFYILSVNMHQTRLGIVYVLTLGIFVLLRNFQLKQYLNGVLIFSLVMCGYSGTNILVSQFSRLFDKSHIYYDPRTIIYDTAQIVETDDDRVEEFILGFNKFREYPLINKFIGTGWYSARITRNLDKDDLGNYFLNHRDKKAHSLQAIIALLLDTGIIGIIFLAKLYLDNFIFIFNKRDSLINRLFYMFMLSLNLGCLFIGYPLVNVAYFLFIFQGGIINFQSTNILEKDIK